MLILCKAGNVFHIVADGENAGYVERSATGWKAFDATGEFVGSFADRDEAVRAAAAS